MGATSRERENAVREHEIKLRLEREFRPKVFSLFVDMQADFLRKVAAGIRFSATPYEKNWRELISTHILKTQKAFSSYVSDTQEKGLTGEMEIFLRKTLFNWKETRADFAAKKIIKTTQSNMDEALNDAFVDLAAENQGVVSNAEISVTAARGLTPLLEARTDIISLMETQSAAETAKLFEAQAVSGLEPDLSEYISKPNLVKTTKVWITMGDDKVRHPPGSKFDHVAAEGQEQNMNDFYIVSGEKLMQPGDMTQGASAGNVFGCRCSSQYRVNI